MSEQTTGTTTSRSPSRMSLERVRAIERLAWEARVWLLNGNEAIAESAWNEIVEVCRP